MQVLRQFASGSNIHHCQPFHPFSLAPDITLKWHQNIVLRNIDGRDFENPFYDGSVGSRLSLQHCIRPICPIMVEDLLRIVAVMHSGRQLVQKKRIPQSLTDLKDVLCQKKKKIILDI